MQVSVQDAIIDLTAAEGAALLGTAEATTEMLVWHGHIYGSFRERLEHQATELHYTAERTVLIFMDGEDDEIARCDDEGLTMLKGEDAEGDE